MNRSEHLTLSMCENCKSAMIELLDKRIAKMLEAAEEDGGDDDIAVTESQRFHLMEIKQIVNGKPTCGVFDDYGGRTQQKESGSS